MTLGPLHADGEIITPGLFEGVVTWDDGSTEVSGPMSAEDAWWWASDRRDVEPFRDGKERLGGLSVRPTSQMRLI